MAKQQVIEMKEDGDVLETSGPGLVREFLKNHGAGLDDLVGRFPGMSGPMFRISFAKHLLSNHPTYELMLALEEAADTLLWLQSRDLGADCQERVNRSEIDSGLRWYAARLSDLAIAMCRM